MQIKSLNGAVLYECETETLKAALIEADKSGADLGGADLRGAKGFWQSHDVIAEILFRAAQDDAEKRSVAGLILVSRDWCWKEFLALNDPLTSWAISVLRPYAEADAENVPPELNEAMVNGTEANDHV